MSPINKSGDQSEGHAGATHRDLDPCVMTKVSEVNRAHEGACCAGEPRLPCDCDNGWYCGCKISSKWGVKNCDLGSMHGSAQTPAPYL